MKQSRCPQYVGVACVDGTCPIANREEYEERGIPVAKDCQECFYYEGCSDCALDNTEYCHNQENKDNWRDDFRLYVFRRISQYKDFGVDVEVMTPQKHNTYVNIRAVLALRFSPERIFKQGGNSKLDHETYLRLCRAVDEMLPERKE